MYSPQLLDHFENPRNSGILAHPDASIQMENPVCGDVLKLMAKVKDGSIAEIRFLAKGCVPAIACGSAVTELVNGKTVEEALAVTRSDLIQAIGPLPEASSHAVALAMDALAALLKSFATLRR